jgi:hypothetical protein
MKTSRITFVRYLPDRGQSVIHDFIMGGRYGPARVPRGVLPEQVSLFITANIQRDTEYLAWPKAWAAAQFYELAGAARYLRSIFEKRDPSDGIGKPAMAVRAAADVGTEEDAKWAADYFDAALVPQSSADTFSLLIQTLPVLAPYGSPDKLAARISGEVRSKALAKDQGEDQMRAFQAAQAIERNDLAGGRLVFDAKTKLAKQAPAERRAELVRIYLKLAAISGDYIEEWAGRMLRKEAMEVDLEPVCQELGKALDLAVRQRTEDKCGFIIARAVQAIIYLQGKPEGRHVEMNERAKDAAQNFLWDDPD